MEINSVSESLKSDVMLLLSDAIGIVNNPKCYAERKLHSCYGQIYIMKDTDTIKTYIDYIKGILSFEYMMQDPFMHSRFEKDGCLWPYYDKDNNSLFSINVIDCSKDNFEKLKYGQYTNDDGSITVGYYLESDNNRTVVNQLSNDTVGAVNKDLAKVDLNIFINFEKKPLDSVLSLIYTKQKSVNVIFAVSEAFDKLNIRCPWDLVHPIDIEDQYFYSKENVDKLMEDNKTSSLLLWNIVKKQKAERNNG